MNESSPSSGIVGISQHFEDDWFTITVVTPKELVAAGIKGKEREAVLKALQLGADPTETLKKASPFGQGPRIVPLTTFEAMDWHADDFALYLHYFDDRRGKLRRVGVEFRDAESRISIITFIKQVVGECEESRVQASIWHIGMVQLTCSTIAIILCGSLAAVGFLSEDPVKTENMRRRSRAFGDLLNAVGPTGMLLIGLAIVAVMMIWWFFACMNPPIRTLAKRIGKSN